MARGIIFKNNGINELSNSPTGYKYLGYDGESLSEKSGSTVNAIGGTPYTPSYKVITGFFTQTGVSQPVLTILENTTLGNFSMTRSGDGDLRFNSINVTYTDIFTVNKVYMTANGVNFTTAFVHMRQSIVIPTRQIHVEMRDGTGSFSAGDGEKIHFEIRIYN